MMQVKEKFHIKHINSFFVEIIIVIFFFTVSCAIIFQVFSIAFEQNNTTDMTNNAVLHAQSISEIFSSNGNIQETVIQLYGERAAAYINNNEVNLPLGSDWKISSVDNRFYINISIENKASEAGELSYAKITVLNKTTELYSVTASAYIAEKGDINE